MIQTSLRVGASVFLVSLQLFTFCCCQDNASVALGITESGLNSLASLGGSLFEKIVGNDRTLPDVSLKRFSSSITSIQVTKFSVTNFVLTSSAQGISPDISIEVSVSFNWKALLLHGSGSVSVAVTLKVTLQVQKVDDNDIYTVRIADCIGSTRIINYDFGAVSVLLRTIIPFFENWIENRLKEELCQRATKLLQDEGTAAINGFNTSTCFSGSNTCIDYGLVRSLVTTDDFVEARVRGRFYIEANPNHTYPCTIGNLTTGPPLYDDCQFYVYVSEYAVNSGLYIYQCSAKPISFSFCLPTFFDLPLRIFLAANPFCRGRRKLASSDNPSKVCTVHFKLKLTRRPVIFMINSTVDVDLGVSAELVMAGCSVCTMHLDAVLNIAVNISVDQSKENSTEESIRLGGTALPFEIKVNGKLCPFLMFGSSSFFPKLFQDMMQRMANLRVLPQLNERLLKGLPLPTLPREIRLVKPSVHVNNGYLTVCFDLR